MRIYRLAAIYRQLREAHQRGDLANSSAALGRALGVRDLTAGGAEIGVPAATPEPGLTYRGFKPAELAMLAASVKPVVKFEDIPLADARHFCRAHSGSYQLSVSQPYRKDYLLMRSQPTAARDPAALVSIYAGRDDRAQRLLELERNEPGNVVAAGELLGFPACCVAAFAADTALSRTDQDTVNDDACRRVLRTAGADGGHPALDPLADLELLGFYPCSLHCQAAIAMALQTWSALVASAPAAAQRCKTLLGRPTVFFRLPFIVRFDGSIIGGQIHYTAARVNVFPDRQVRAIQVRFARVLATLVADGNRISVTGSSIDVLRDDQPLASWRLDDAHAATQCGYRSWPAQFFDPP